MHNHTMCTNTPTVPLSLFEICISWPSAAIGTSCPEFIRGGRKSDNKRPLPGAERIKLGVRLTRTRIWGSESYRRNPPTGPLSTAASFRGFKPKLLRPNLKYVDFGHCCGLGGLECLGRRGSEEPNIPPEIHAQIGWGPERVT